MAPRLLSAIDSLTRAVFSAVPLTEKPKKTFAARPPRPARPQFQPATGGMDRQAIQNRDENPEREAMIAQAVQQTMAAPAIPG